MADGLEGLRDGAGSDDPWVAFLLGCVSLARGVEQGARESLAPDEAAAPADAGDPAVAWLLGAVALSRRLQARVAGIEAPPRDEVPPRASRRGLLR